MLIFGFIFLLLMLYAGSRYGGVGLGVVSGIGLMVEVFIFRMPPSTPPVTVIMIIMAVVTCAAVLETAGGLKYMLQKAERILRNHPRRIVILGPLCAYLMTVMLGTGHAVYSILPIIGDIALRNGIRPERAMAASSVSAQMGITASPISAAVVFYLASLGGMDDSFTLLSILEVTVPSTILGVLAVCLYSLRRGRDLEDDPEYQARLQDPVWGEKIRTTTATSLDEELPGTARNAVLIFIGALVSIVVVAMWPGVRTFPGEETPVAMAVIIQIMMLAFGGLILVAGRVKAARVPEGVVFKSGLVAAIAIFGIAWMSDTYFQYALPAVRTGITEVVNSQPWTFALAMFIVSVVINSQAATCRMMLPVGMGLGLSPALLVGIMPSCYGYFFIPNYPSDIAACNFDVTGTTRIGKYYFNHSFMLPGLVGVGTACVFGYFWARLLF